MDDLDKISGLASKIEQDFLKRSRQGVWAHPLGMVLVLLTTDLVHRIPKVCIFFAASILLVTLIRGLTLYTPVLGKKLFAGSALTVHIGFLLTCSAIWGIVPAVALATFGFRDQDVLILLLYQAVFAIGSVNVLVHNRRLIAVIVFLFFAVPAIGDLLHGDRHPFDYLAAIALYAAYCLIQGKKLNQLYCNQISDNFDLSVAAYRDSLTGLPNRLYMDHAVETCVEDARKRGLQIALLYIDLDGFKQINDRHSHRVGDLFLCEAAARIRQSLRKHDIAARIGGDEFTVLLPECHSEQDALGVAKRVLSAARLPVLINGHHLNYSASIGVSLFPKIAGNMEMLVRSADEAMYAAKALGKDRICVQLPGGGRKIVSATAITNSLALRS